MQRKPLLAAAIAAAALTACAVPLAANASPEAPARHEVLQAAFHPFSDAGTTRQDLSQRCVLLESYVGENGTDAAFSRQAAYTLVNNTTRQGLAYAELAPNATRYFAYYQGQLTPAAIFDGTGEQYGGTAQTTNSFELYFDAKRAVPAGASINVSGGVVISHGYLDWQVFAPADLSNYIVSVRAFVVEDHVVSPSGARDLRFVVRQYLTGERLDLVGNASGSGRLEFGVEDAWVESELAAVVFVQVDSPRSFDRPAAPVAFDLLGAVLVPLAILVTLTTMAVIVAGYIRAERRARLR